MIVCCFWLFWNIYIIYIVPGQGKGSNIGHATDDGYFGKGIYTSPDPNYAKGYGDCDKVFICLSLPGKMWASEYPHDSGKPCRNGYDSHYDKRADSLFASAFKWKKKQNNNNNE